MDYETKLPLKVKGKHPTLLHACNINVAKTVGENARGDARRLAACWNACADIPTETLERGDLFAALKELRGE